MYLRDKDGKLKAKMNYDVSEKVLQRVSGKWEHFKFKDGTSQNCFVISEPMWCGLAHAIEVHLNVGDYLAHEL